MTDPLVMKVIAEVLARREVRATGNPQAWPPNAHHRDAADEIMAAVGPTLLAERDELREALRARLESEFRGDMCSFCGGSWDAHRYVRGGGCGLLAPCPLTKPCALVGSRHPAQPRKGTPDADR